jgi:DNA-binding CsgD family transcriptional regulator/tetratricopeptide (TPR) repeat protein
VPLDAAYRGTVEPLERGPQLALVRRWMRDITIQGRCLVVTGEAGAGKSTLVRAATAGARSMRVVRGLCDPLSTPRPLGPVRDVLLDLAALPDSGIAGSAASLSSSGLGERLLEAARTEPTTIVIEDVQWIDGASVEVLRFLARRIDAIPVLLVLTYRAAEIGAAHSLRPLLGELARLEASTTLELPPLTLDAVRVLLAGTTLDATSVRRLTGGNAFYVSEIARHPDVGMPETIRDAVLASTSAVTSADLEVLQLIAAAPDGLDDRLLPFLGVDLPTLRRLDTTGLLIRSRRGVGFRHELARLAIEESVALGHAAALHARIVDALEAISAREWSVLTHHARAAGDAERTGRYAELAAEEAAQSGSHSEAASFLRLALGQSRLDAAGRARLLERLGFELYMLNELADATQAIGQALRLWDEVDDRPGLIGAHEKSATIEYYSARRKAAELHARLARELAETAASPVAFGGATATMGFLAFRRNDFGEALTQAESALAIASDFRADHLRVRSQLITGLSDVAAGSGPRVDLSARPADGYATARHQLLAHIDEAITRSFDETASMGFSQLETIDVEQRRFREAEDLLSRSLPFTVDRDIPVCTHVQTGLRARLHFHRGRWAAALEDAETVLAGGAHVARPWPHLVVGLVALRTGTQADSAVADQLDAAWSLAGQLDEPLAWLPALSALAERMWTTGLDDDRVQAATKRLDEWASLPGVSYAIGDLAVWLHRLGIDTAVADRSAEPYRLELAGDADAAAAWWRGSGSPFEAALAAVHGRDESAAGQAIEDLENLGAVATADRCRTALVRRGISAVPPRRRASTRSNPSGLTNRQLDVARLVARGLTNAELAQHLFISPKTADHHVSAILTRLGLATRRDIIRRAAELRLG